eukprot:43576_1
MDATVQLATQLCLAMSFCGSFLLSLYIHYEVRKPMGERAYLLMNLTISCTSYNFFRFIEGSIYTIDHALFPCKLFAMLSYSFSTIMFIWSCLLVIQFFTYQLENIAVLRGVQQPEKEQILQRPKLITSKKCKYSLVLIYVIPLTVYLVLLFTNHYAKNHSFAKCVVTPASLDAIYWVPSWIIYIISVIVAIITLFVIQFKRNIYFKVHPKLSTNHHSNSLISMITNDSDEKIHDNSVQSLQSTEEENSMLIEVFADSSFADEIGSKEILVIIIAYLITWFPSGIRDLLYAVNVQNNTFNNFCAIMTHLYGLWIGLFFGYFMTISEEHRQQIKPRILDGNQGLQEVLLNQQDPPIRWYHWAAWIWLVVVRGSVFLAIKILEPTVPPMVIVSSRLCIGSLFLTAFIGTRAMLDDTFRQKLKVLTKKSLLIHLMIFAAAKSYIPWVLLSYGEQSIPSGVASILLSIGPIVATLSTMIVLKKKVTILTMIGIFVALVGTIFVFEKEMTDFDSNKMFHYGLIIIAACFYGGSKAYAKKYIAKKEHDVTAMAFGTMMCASFLSVVFAVSIELPKTEFRFFAHLSTEQVVVLILLGVCSAGISAILYFWCLSVMGPVKVAFTAYLVPLIGLIEGIFVEGEWRNTSWLYKASEIVGLGFILLGFYLMRRSK